MLNISCNVLNTILKVKNRMLLSISAVYPHDCVADWKLGPFTTQQECITHVSLTQDQNSKFEIWFLWKVYCFCTTIKLKNHQ